jgi:hypothetical protein
MDVVALRLRFGEKMLQAGVSGLDESNARGVGIRSFV